MPTLELNGKPFAEQTGTGEPVLKGNLNFEGPIRINNQEVLSANGSIRLTVDEISEKTQGSGITLSHSLKNSSGSEIISPSGTVSNLTKLSLTPSSAPSSPVQGDIYLDSSDSQLKIYNGSSWKKILSLFNDGSSSDLAAPSAKYLTDNLNFTTSGTYWIMYNGTPTQIYCDLSTSGGGWMHFAGAPSSGNWFGGNIAANWDTVSYTYGTPVYDGTSGNFWRDFSTMGVSEVLFRTGNGTYWLHLLLNQINYNTSFTYPTPQATSSNFPNQTCDPNNTATILYRTTNSEDAWINAGNSHTCGGNYMFWGETSDTNYITFKNANGGIMVFVR